MKAEVKVINPYKSFPPRSFWRSAVAELDALDISGLWMPKFTIGQDDPVLTAGSCFAAHIGRALLNRGMNWRDAEPAPPGLTEAQRGARQFGIFSFRTGNIYTAAMLRQWLAWSHGESPIPDETWQEGDRYFDPFRPSIEPDGYASADALLASRHTTLISIRSAVADAACLIFTLGLTEAWRERANGVVYPVCPGTVRGVFDESRHEFHNFTFDEVYHDLSTAIALARAVNPQLRIVLTVSPVPLTATATADHVLAASTYSKSVLRAVAGQLTEEHDHVDYFPSFEIVSGFPFKGMFFEPNLRSVTPEGVTFVMRHFLDAFSQKMDVSQLATCGEYSGDDELICDDAVLDYYNNC
ncbi:GSCFA domain-containing protein [Nonomuraea sp. NPDC002799]